MISGASGEVWRLPSGLRFLEAIADTVASGGATSLLLEDWVDRPAFLDELRSHLFVRGLTLQALQDVDSVSASPLDCLVVGLGLPDVRSRYDHSGDAMLRLVGLAGLPNVTAVVASDTNGLGTAAWIDFAQAWSESSKRLSDSGGMASALCVVLSPLAARDRDLPTDAQMHACWMLGVPEAIEVRLVCRLVDEGDTLAARRWREHVVPALCGSDLGLLPHLWTAVLEDRAALLAALDGYAQERDWDEEGLRELGVDRLARSRVSEFDGCINDLTPPPRLRQAWSSGAVMASADHGTEVNSAALPLVDAEDVLLQRLWRGQVGLVLPGIDGVRMAMCSQLTRRFGSSWATEFCLPPIEDEAIAVRESSLACQWGHLLWLLRNHRRLSDYSEWIPVARRARRVRNRLAHGVPIAYSEYADLLEAAQTCGLAQWL